MPIKIKGIGFILILLMFLLSFPVARELISSGGSYLEKFDESNRPKLEYYPLEDYFLVKPWNYEKDYNASRKYPLLIYLHGAGQTKYLKNLSYMGMGYYEWNDKANNMTKEFQRDVADRFRKTYPCFMLVPQGHDGWSTTRIIAQIEQLKEDYRIDPKRIYIHGTSDGADIIYPLAREYYIQKEQLFAGIISLDGSGGEFKLPEAVLMKTPQWLILGGRSSNYPAGTNTFKYLKNHSVNSDSAIKEKLNYYISDKIDPFKPGLRLASTTTLVRDDSELLKQTVFHNADNNVTSLPFEDSEVLKWLFSHSM